MFDEVEQVDQINNKKRKHWAKATKTKKNENWGHIIRRKKMSILNRTDSELMEDEDNK